MGGGAGVPRAAGVLPVWLTHRRKYDAWGPMCRCADVADALITDTGFSQGRRHVLNFMGQTIFS